MITTLQETRWFSYILFLVFFGSILVLFIYVTRLTSNKIFHLNIKAVISPPIIIIIIIILLIIDPLIITTPHSLQDSLEILIDQQAIPALKFYNKSLSPMTLTLAVYLSIIFNAVVKITNLQLSPLRPNKSYVNTNTKTTSSS